MKFSNMKIGARLAMGFAWVILAGLVVAIVGSVRLNTIEQETTRLVQDRMAKVNQANEVLAALNQVARRTRDIALGTDTQKMLAEKRLIDEAVRSGDAILQQLDASVQDAAARQLMDTIGKVRAPYLESVGRANALALEFKTAEAAEVISQESAPLLDTFLKALLGLAERQEVLMQESATTVQGTARATTWLMLGIAALAAVFGALVAWSMNRSITRPIERAVALAQAVAAGDLTRSVPIQGRDETAQLLGALAHMQGALVQLVTRVRQGSEGVASASTQIAQGNQDLSGRTESQASALEETAASMEELGSTVRQNADNARQANQLAVSASRVAEQGGQVVAEVVSTMRQIDTDSHRIADIIGVIDSIAFQTNILALNAAVEAARAGEQGRGFAVVASEVRSLAKRSADAAKEIKQLINDSVERVEQGTQLVDKAGVTMAEVVGSIRRVTDLMGEISAASGEQSQGVGQIGEAVAQMDQATQQNAALVEEMAAAAASLNGQAHELVQAVGVFQLAEGATRQPAAPATRAAGYAAAPARAGVPQRAMGHSSAQVARLAMPALQPAALAEQERGWENF